MINYDNNTKKFIKKLKKEILTDEFIEDSLTYELGAMYAEHLCDGEEGKIFKKAKEEFDKYTDNRIDLLIEKHLEEL